MTTEKHAKCHPAFTLVEVILAVGMVAVVALAVTGMVYSSYQDWQVVSRRSNVLQDGRAAIELMVRTLRQAKEVIAITPSSSLIGLIRFTSVDDITEEFILNPSTGELLYRDPCSTSALIGPVNFLTFTYYDIEGNALTPSEVADIRSIIIQAEFADAEDPSLTFTLSGRVFVQTDDPTSSCLLAWWKLNDGFGLTAADSSRNGYDGSLENMDGTEWTAGVIGGALDFDGNDDYIDSSVQGDVVVDDLTFTAWFNSDDAGSIGDDRVAQRFVSQVRSGSNSRLALGINNNRIGTYWFDGGHNVGEGTTTLSDGVWYHAALTYDGARVRIYLDGAEEDSFPESKMTAPSSSNIEIAQDLDGTHLFDGILDDVRIYRCALETADIAALAACLRYRQFTEARADFDTTSITIDTPGAAGEGDLLIAAIATDGDTSLSLAPPGGQGWTEIDIDDYSSAVTLAAWWKNADASESPTHEFTWTPDQQAYGWMMRFTGHDSSDPVNFWAADGESSATPTSPAVVTTVDNCLILRLGAFDDDDITVDSPGLSGHAAITMEASDAGVPTSGVCVVLDPTDAGIGDPLNLTLYVDGVETHLAHLNIWGVEEWTWEEIPAVIPSLTAQMLAATDWRIEYPDVYVNVWEHVGGGTFAEAIAAGGFGDGGCDFSGGSEGTASGGAGYVSQIATGDSGTSTFALTASHQARTLTIAIAPAL